MTAPAPCQLLTDPETVIADPMRERFERLETCFAESHHWRYQLRCRACGALYLFEFFEEIDWQQGDDPSWTTWLTVASPEAAAVIAADTAPLSLRQHRPYLAKDWPAGAAAPAIFWIAGGTA